MGCPAWWYLDTRGHRCEDQKAEVGDQVKGGTASRQWCFRELDGLGRECEQYKWWNSEPPDDIPIG